MRWTLLLTLVAVAPAAAQTAHNIHRRETLPSDIDNYSDDRPCTACRVREDLKHASLEYIKAYVLHNLGFERPPNITQIPRVPDSIYASFYNVTARHALTHDEDMLADEPSEIRELEPMPERFYILAEYKKMRHGRRQVDILYFPTSPLTHTVIYRATLTLFVRGIEWIARQEGRDIASLLHRPNITIFVHRIVRSVMQPDAIHSRVDTEITIPLDAGLGENVVIDVTPLVMDWYSNIQSNNGLFMRTREIWMKQLLQLDDPDGANAPFLEIETRDRRHRRPKRSTSLTCRENENETRCCRYPLVVDFDKFGWDWVIAPKQYEANYCSGECSINFLTRYGHTHVMQLASSAQACCSPRKMAPLTLLYFNPQEQIVHTTLQNMIVQMCSCS
ncbi:growth/differentiation factor 8 [Phlebotomus argentipes]|uniref:growth/differentiation factor 8 n=1 Tax=Phlebotomus argentipes TaxID=94469 RepID=UPI0028932CAC|nr:growth/differentiation factor 8 [Phlebotomus argentipes]